MLAPSRQFDWSELSRHIDHTLLKPTATTPDFEKLFDEAVKYNFFSVCVPPSRVPSAAKRLRGTGVKVCAVVGFPLGYNSPEVKREEARRAMLEGAQEIDMVMNVSAFKGGEFDLVARDIDGIASDCRFAKRVLKVIIECCYLTDEEKVKAAKLAERMGADYVKTSTGFGPSGATVSDVVLLRRSLQPKTRIKAAGGISTLAKALEMIEAGADRLGTSSGAIIMEELEKLDRGVGSGRLSAAQGSGTSDAPHDAVVKG
jgi:deoxyribose-phosphate aldolase